MMKKQNGQMSVKPLTKVKPVKVKKSCGCSKGK